jgi:hypothetical protein
MLRIGTGITIKQTTPTEVQENASLKEQTPAQSATGEEIVRRGAAQMKSELQMFGSLQEAKLRNAAGIRQHAELLNGELKKYGVELSPESLNNLTSTIAEGGKTGLYTSIALSYATAKLAAGPPLSDGVEEFLTSLAQNPDQSEEFMNQMISDPNFYPITSEQLQTISNLIPAAAGQYLSQCIAKQYNPTSKLPEDEATWTIQDVEAARKEVKTFEQFTTMIDKTFQFLGTQEPNAFTRMFQF